jgi:sterol 14-demethylase
MLEIIAGALVAVVVVFTLLFGFKKRPKNAPPNARCVPFRLESSTCAVVHSRALMLQPWTQPVHLSPPPPHPSSFSLGMPVVGNFIEFGKNPVDFIARCLEKYGAIYTVPMLHKNLTFLLGPEVSAPFFRLNDDFMSQPEVYGFMTPVFGKGVVYDAEPKKRTQQYQSMAQGLRAQRLKAYVPKIEMETLAYLKEKWGASGTVNILDALSELTILTSSRCLHGDDVRENLFGEVARIYHDLDKGVTPLSFFFPYAPTEAHRLRDAARKEMVAIFSKVINARKEKGVDSTEATDILQIFIDMEYKDGTKLTADEIVGLLIALLFAGQHTSSITSTWTAMFLAHNPRCLAEVLKEQQEVLGDNNKDVPLNFDTVGKMEYLQNCVKESLRMYPPLIMLMRMAMQDITTTLNGKEYIIPKVPAPPQLQKGRGCT